MKRKRTRLVSVLLLVCMTALLLSGCGAKAKSKVTYIPLGTNGSEDAITHIFAEKFAEETKRLSDGDMLIKVYPNGTMGNDKDLLEACADGDIPFVVQNTAPQVALIPDVAVFDLPMAFDTIEDARAAIDDETFYSLLSESYIESGYRLLGTADQGFRVMTTNKHTTAAKDFKGQKIRTMDNTNHLLFWQYIGANPTPMAFSEVYIGLQQKTIDAQENPVDVILAGKLYEQQKYIIETNHLPHYLTLIMSDEFYGKLNSEEQSIVDEAAQIATAYTRVKADEQIGEQVDQMEEQGIEVVSLSAEVRNELRDLSSNIYENIRGQVKDELVDAYKTNR